MCSFKATSHFVKKKLTTISHHFLTPFYSFLKALKHCNPPSIPFFKQNVSLEEKYLKLKNRINSSYLQCSSIVCITFGSVQPQCNITIISVTTTSLTNDMPYSSNIAATQKKCFRLRLSPIDNQPKNSFFQTTEFCIVYSFI